MIIDYSAHFWGEKHIGYNVLYDHMKKGQDAVHELFNFIKERISMEDDILKCLGRHLTKVNTYTTNNGSLVDAWRLTKNKLENWIEIKSKLVQNLGDLSREIFRYQEELTKIRKKAKDIETLEAINLMQTTTTCLQKAKETYMQRCSEIGLLQIKNKLNKSHIEYRQYMEKYAQIRDIFEEKILRAAKMFQEHDREHILQMKKFFLQLANCLETSYNFNAKTAIDYRQNLELIDIEEIMLKFIEEKGTGTDVPKKLNWTEADELPQELDVISTINSHSSSSNNSSAIIAPTFSSSIVVNTPPQPPQPPLQTTTTVNDLLNFDDQWGQSTDSNLFEIDNNKYSFNKKSQLEKMKHYKQSASEADEEEEKKIAMILKLKILKMSNKQILEYQHINIPCDNQQQQLFSISTVQHQISSWLGRQKQAASHWRLKKHSASQSSLPTAIANELITTNEKLPVTGQFVEFSKNCCVNEGKGRNGGGGGSGGFSKRYQKKINAKNSTAEISQTKMKRAYSQFQLEEENFDISSVVESKEIKDPLQEFGPPPPLPTTEPPPLFDNNFHQSLTPQNVSFLLSNEKQPINHPPTYNIGKFSNNNNHWSADSSSTSDEEDTSTQFQTSKIRQLQIRPLNEEIQKNTSLDELRSAIGQIGLPKSSTIENEKGITTEGSTNKVIPPLRVALTGDAQYRRVPSNDLAQSFSVFSTSNSIARARPRSHTPLIFGPTSTSTFIKPQISLNQTTNSGLKITESIENENNIQQQQ
ncbi:hypothetical protein Mgra_00005455 [Meloidogyne graminicola]|uniref:GMIP/FCHO2-like FCH domain-containing protein n=1 Tax=Meloidogyne graminicola TaxID=189291 RepID=A0A8S9ZP24_9BILA|nr:hypothetical protein Mgra_00005455 [Meloidogyne graminicola]